MRSTILTSVIALILTAGVARAHAEGADIGVIQTLKGTAVIEREGKKRRAVIGQRLHENDILRTARNGAMGVVLTDNTILSLGPNSELVVDEFVFVPKDRKLSMITRMAKGTVEYIAGTIGRLAPESVRFETPLAILGIRGTRFVVKIE